MLLRSATQLHSRKVSVTLGADGRQNVKRIRELCDSLADQIEEDNESDGAAYHRTIDSMRWASVALSEGFLWEELGLACLTEHQVFGRQRAQRRSKKQEGGFSLRDLQK